MQFFYKIISVVKWIIGKRERKVNESEKIVLSGETSCRYTHCFSFGPGVGHYRFFYCTDYDQPSHEDEIVCD